MIQAYVYVLHMQEPMSHAQHYSGCTSNLQRRLMRHAAGHGSKLLREAMARGIPWELATISICSHAQMRRLERDLKDQHNGPRFCGICNPDPVRLPGTLPVSLKCFRGMRSSVAMRHKAGREVRIEPAIGLIDPASAPEALGMQVEFIRKLMQADKDALGFIPAGGPEGITHLIQKRQIAVAWEGQRVIGYALWTVNPRPLGGRVKIHQCVIADDWRLCGLGSKIVSQVRDLYPTSGVCCTVRNDLAANHFWQQIGFGLVGSRKHTTSGSTLNDYLVAPLAEATALAEAEPQQHA